MLFRCGCQVSGPGCKAGLLKLFDDRAGQAGRSHTRTLPYPYVCMPAGLSDEELLFWLRDNLEAAFNSRNLPLNQHVSNAEQRACD